MWDKLQKATKPIVLYGTGNAAEKIIAELNKRNIAIAGIFASDGFVRSRTFAGYPVISYQEAKEKFGDMIVLLCFGSHLSEVIENIKLINEEQEMYAPDLPVLGDGLFYEEYSKNKEQFDALKASLADDKSREVLAEVVQYKLDGRINHLLSCETDDNENWGILGLNSKEVYLDLGAYNGDTVRQFLGLTGMKYKEIIAIEPETRNFRKLSENTADLKDVCLVNKAIGHVQTEVMFTKSTGRGGAVGKGKQYPVEMDTVDNILSGKPVSFIKMDLEGYEQRAILGAKETISKYKPKMLISAYHQNDDLWMIPKLVLEINPEYKVYLRKSPCLPAWEVNYYFI